MQRARNRKNWKADEDEGGYISLHFPMLDHTAFRELSEAGIRVLLHCLRKAYGPDRYKKIFKFTYPEAKNKLRISNSVFRRAMKQLHQVGFIDYYSPGGLRGEKMLGSEQKKFPKGYQLSLRWKKYRTPDFEDRSDGYYKSIHE